MSAERALFNAYREWLRFARAAHKAICKRDWAFLLKCLSITGRIQPSIPNLYQEAREEWRRFNVDRAVKEKELRALISELIALLESNKKLLCAARAKALSKREKLEQAGRNLKRLQSSYCSSAGSRSWTSFS